MNILLLAPHPFFQNRGTPIAVDLLVKTLCDSGHSVHILTFNEGEDRHYNNLTISRVGKSLGLSNINPGFSLKKIVLDAVMLFHMVALHRKNRYDVVHAVEESAFLAWFTGLFTKVPFIYDMDSSMVTQLTDKMSFMRPFIGVLRKLEAILIKKSLLVIPVCDSLVDLCEQYRPDDIYLLKDVSMLDATPLDALSEDLKAQYVSFKSLYQTPRQFLFYAGNLESYQGIDLMIRSFALAVHKRPALALIIVGGNESDINLYRKLCEELGVEQDVQFLGPKPVALLKSFCDQADLLLSPRVLGENTPMKIFSYLGSGRPVLATDLPTHTEVVDETLGYLGAPDPASFSTTMVEVFDDYAEASERAVRAQEFIEQNHSLKTFATRVKTIYEKVERSIELRQKSNG